MSLKVIHYPHPTLRHVSKPLKRVDAELRKMVEEMFDLMYEHEGIGLAANQVDLPYRVFVTNVEGDPDITETERVYINPVISKGKGSAEAKEGCLSLPGVYGPVTRYQSIHVEAYDLNGNPINEDLKNMDARVVMHETDHLDGRLFIDRLTPTNQSQVRPALSEFEIAFQSQVESGDLPDATAMAAHLAELEKLRT